MNASIRFCSALSPPRGGHEEAGVYPNRHHNTGTECASQLGCPDDGRIYVRGITCISTSSGPSSLHSGLSRCKGSDDRIVQHLSAPKRVVSHRAISCLTFRLGHIRDNKWDKCGICYKSPSLCRNFSCCDRHLRDRVSSVLVVGVRKNCLFWVPLPLAATISLSGLPNQLRLPSPPHHPSEPPHHSLSLQPFPWPCQPQSPNLP